jgi:hypothetical protein
MNTPEDDFDPDDNFANAFARGTEADDDESHEALVWQLLLLVNPGDEEAALQQFTAWRDARVDAGGDDGEGMEMLRDVIDWKSGFHVAADDAAAFIDSIDELVARWNLRIDWGSEDPGDDDFLAATDVPELMATAYDRLREYGYTLWTWNAPGGDGAYAGWIASSRDDEAMQVLAPALGIEVRPASDAA